MKKRITWYKQFFCRNISGWREQYQRPCCRPSDAEPVTDVNGLRYVFPYKRMYETAIEAIIKAGWHKSWPLILGSKP